MPKKGLRQPWRVVYLWQNGVKGTASYGSEGDAQLFVDALRRTAQLRCSVVTFKMVNTNIDPTPIPKIYRELEASRGY